MLGMRQVYPGRYEPQKLLHLIAEHGVTFSHCVPAVLGMVLGATGAEAVNLAGWKVIIGGSALPEGLARAAMARGIDIHAGYGMSETCPLCDQRNSVPMKSLSITLARLLYVGIFATYKIWLLSRCPA